MGKNVCRYGCDSQVVGGRARAGSECSELTPHWSAEMPQWLHAAGDES